MRHHNFLKEDCCLPFPIHDKPREVEIGGWLASPRYLHAVVDMASLDDEAFVEHGIFNAREPSGREWRCQVQGLDLVRVARYAWPGMTVAQLDRMLQADRQMDPVDWN